MMMVSIKQSSTAHLTGDAMRLSAARVLDGKYHKKASAVHTLMNDFPKYPSTRIHPEPGPDQIVSTGLLILPMVTWIIKQKAIEVIRIMKVFYCQTLLV
jgi:hypothetical protein